MPRLAFVSEIICFARGTGSLPFALVNVVYPVAGHDVLADVFDAEPDPRTVTVEEGVAIRTHLMAGGSRYELPGFAPVCPVPW